MYTKINNKEQCSLIMNYNGTKSREEGMKRNEPIGTEKYAAPSEKDR